MPDTRVTLALTGQSLIKHDVLGGAAEDTLAVARLTRDAQFSFTNFEGTIRGRHGGWPMKSTFLHASTPAVFDCLKAFGFNLLALSNNHAFDLGPGGILSAIDEAKARSFAHAGTGCDLRTATQAAIATHVGTRMALVAMDAGPQGEHVYAMDERDNMAARPGSNRLRVHTTLTIPQAEFQTISALGERLGYAAKRAADHQVGYRQMLGAGYEFYGLRFEAGTAFREHRYADADDVARNLAAIAHAANTADHVIAYIHHHHWNPQWEETPEWFQKFARQCIDAGAAAVVSHGVPMLQGIEIYRDAPLIYGLGNFIFHTYQAEKYTDVRIWQSAVVRVVFEHKRCAEVELHPIVLGGQQALAAGDYAARHAPHLARGSYGTMILERLASMSRAFGTRIEISNGRGRIQCT